MLRLIATDMDGTLLESDRGLPERTYEVIKELKKLGIRFAAASGRQHANLRQLFGPVADEIAYVCENGAVSVIDDQIAGVIPIPAEMTREIISDIESLGMNCMVSCRHTIYMLDRNRRFTDDIVYRLRNAIQIISSWDCITEPMLKISGQIDAGVQPIAPLLLEKWGNRLTATISGFDWFDITCANKGMGVEKLMLHMDIDKNEVAAFGDNFNDESMLDLVGHPFIMSKADPQLHKSAYHVCDRVLPVLEAIVEAKGDINKALRLCEQNWCE